ncbi:MAG TPA: glucose-6-phosphate isomerase, partial [Oscillospiraceae bacterium]|nr:glucose-6-phosphate isomerase [Oscillospiraceae bacterium]
MIRVDLSQTAPFLPASALSALYPRVAAAHETLESGAGAGAEFTGWLRLPTNCDRAELSRIKAAAEKIRRTSEVLFVVGIGGSYLGARAALDFVLSPYHNALRNGGPEVYFTGNSLSGDDLAALLAILGDRDFSVNVISKSGTTTEPAVAFRILRAKLREKYGDAARSRIYATTDRARGALKALAKSEGWETFVVPDDIGGRYSVLTAVGLLPMAAAGIDVDRVLRGAAEAQARYAEKSEENPVWQYVAARNALYEAGKSVELLTCYEPSFQMTAEWWKQLFGESEGKGHRGLFPASALFTTDLHSLGQYVQDGARLFLETVVRFTRPRHPV